MDYDDIIALDFEGSHGMDGATHVFTCGVGTVDNYVDVMLAMEDAMRDGRLPPNATPYGGRVYVYDGADGTASVSVSLEALANDRLVEVARADIESWSDGEIRPPWFYKLLGNAE